MALQGLWAVPWMMEVQGLSRSDAAGVLFLLAVAMLLGFLFVATCSPWLARRGVAPMSLLSAGMGLALAVQLCIIADLAQPTWLWPLFGLSFSLSNIAFSQLSAAFSSALSGRVNTALNLMVFVGAFGLQWGVGAAVDAFAGCGMPRVDAFRLSFSILLAAQVLAYLWYLRPRRRAVHARL